jgi:hypothetical protein
MPINRPWKIVGATAAVAGLGIAATNVGSNGIELRDRADPVRLTAAPATVHDVSVAATDDSPESADSPGASAADSAESASDSPGDPGWVDPSPESADSPGDSPFDSPVPPPHAPAPLSADSPPQVMSADSPDSAASDD